MIRQFTWYLHDQLESSERKEFFEDALPDVEFTDELMEKIGRPFYEVALICTLDTETGKIEIKSARQV